MKGTFLGQLLTEKNFVIEMRESSGGGRMGSLQTFTDLQGCLAFVDIRASRHRGITVCRRRVPQVVNVSYNALNGANLKNCPLSADVGLKETIPYLTLGIIGTCRINFVGSGCAREISGKMVVCTCQEGWVPEFQKGGARGGCGAPEW